MLPTLNDIPSLATGPLVLKGNTKVPDAATNTSSGSSLTPPSSAVPAPVQQGASFTPAIGQPAAPAGPRQQLVPSGTKFLAPSALNEIAAPKDTEMVNFGNKLPDTSGQFLYSPSNPDKIITEKRSDITPAIKASIWGSSVRQGPTGEIAHGISEWEGGTGQRENLSPNLDQSVHDNPVDAILNTLYRNPDLASKPPEQGGIGRPLSINEARIWTARGKDIPASTWAGFQFKPGSNNAELAGTAKEQVAMAASAFNNWQTNGINSINVGTTAGKVNPSWWDNVKTAVSALNPFSKTNKDAWTTIKEFTAKELGGANDYLRGQENQAAASGKTLDTVLAGTAREARLITNSVLTGAGSVLAFGTYNPPPEPNTSVAEKALQFAGNVAGAVVGFEAAIGAIHGILTDAAPALAAKLFPSAEAVSAATAGKAGISKTLAEFWVKYPGIAATFATIGQLTAADRNSVKERLQQLENDLLVSVPLSIFKPGLAGEHPNLPLNPNFGLMWTAASVAGINAWINKADPQAAWTNGLTMAALLALGDVADIHTSIREEAVNQATQARAQDLTTLPPGGGEPPPPPPPPPGATVNAPETQPELPSAIGTSSEGFVPQAFADPNNPTQAEIDAIKAGFADEAAKRIAAVEEDTTLTPEQKQAKETDILTQEKILLIDSLPPEEKPAEVVNLAQNLTDIVSNPTIETSVVPKAAKATADIIAAKPAKIPIIGEPTINIVTTNAVGGAIPPIVATDITQAIKEGLLVPTGTAKDKFILAEGARVGMALSTFSETAKPVFNVFVNKGGITRSVGVITGINAQAIAAGLSTLGATGTEAASLRVEPVAGGAPNGSSYNVEASIPESFLVNGAGRSVRLPPPHQAPMEPAHSALTESQIALAKRRPGRGGAVAPVRSTSRSYGEVIQPAPRAKPSVENNQAILSRLNAGQPASSAHIPSMQELKAAAIARKEARTTYTPDKVAAAINFDLPTGGLKTAAISAMTNEQVDQSIADTGKAAFAEGVTPATKRNLYDQARMLIAEKAMRIYDAYGATPETAALVSTSIEQATAAAKAQMNQNYYQGQALPQEVKDMIPGIKERFGITDDAEALQQAMGQYNAGVAIGAIKPENKSAYPMLKAGVSGIAPEEAKVEVTTREQLSHIPIADRVKSGIKYVDASGDVLYDPTKYVQQGAYKTPEKPIAPIETNRQPVAPGESKLSKVLQPFGAPEGHIPSTEVTAGAPIPAEQQASGEPKTPEEKAALSQKILDREKPLLRDQLVNTVRKMKENIGVGENNLPITEFQAAMTTNLKEWLGEVDRAMKKRSLPGKKALSSHPEFAGLTPADRQELEQYGHQVIADTAAWSKEAHPRYESKSKLTPEGRFVPDSNHLPSIEEGDAVNKFNQLVKDKVIFGTADEYYALRDHYLNGTDLGQDPTFKWIPEFNSVAEDAQKAFNAEVSKPGSKIMDTGEGPERNKNSFLKAYITGDLSGATQPVVDNPVIQERVREIKQERKAENVKLQGNKLDDHFAAASKTAAKNGEKVDASFYRAVREKLRTEYPGFEDLNIPDSSAEKMFRGDTGPLSPTSQNRLAQRVTSIGIADPKLFFIENPPEGSFLNDPFFKAVAKIVRARSLGNPDNVRTNLSVNATPDRPGQVSVPNVIHELYTDMTPLGMYLRARADILKGEDALSIKAYIQTGNEAFLSERLQREVIAFTQEMRSGGQLATAAVGPDGKAKSAIGEARPTGVEPMDEEEAKQLMDESGVSPEDINFSAYAGENGDVSNDTLQAISEKDDAEMNKQGSSYHDVIMSGLHDPEIMKLIRAEGPTAEKAAVERAASVYTNLLRTGLDTQLSLDKLAASREENMKKDLPAMRRRRAALADNLTNATDLSSKEKNNLRQQLFVLDQQLQRIQPENIPEEHVPNVKSQIKRAEEATHTAPVTEPVTMSTKSESPEASQFLRAQRLASLFGEKTHNDLSGTSSENQRSVKNKRLADIFVKNKEITASIPDKDPRKTELLKKGQKALQTFVKTKDAATYEKVIRDLTKKARQTAVSSPARQAEPAKPGRPAYRAATSSVYTFQPRAHYESIMSDIGLSPAQAKAVLDNASALSGASAPAGKFAVTPISLSEALRSFGRPDLLPKLHAAMKERAAP